MSDKGSTLAAGLTGVKTMKGGKRTAKLVGVGLLVGLLLGSLTMALYTYRIAPRKPAAAAVTTSRNESIVTAISREQQVVLLSVGQQGILTKETHSELFGKEVPGTGRAVWIQYSYRAKLGLDGAQVRVTQTGDKAFRLSLPDFLFIGHEGEEFKVIVEKNGVLSAVTPEIDKVQLVNEVLNDKSKTDVVNVNRPWLEEQAKAFYTGIIHAIDPAITVEVEFRRS